MYDDQLINIPPPTLINPAISVIIPLYNAEKYIGECIDSILAQTFKDFELIIVDDCSTDSSCEIVESYMPKFNGRLKLYHTEKNTGSGVIARNIGLSKATGEYVYNMDNDDAITETALEEMYSLAKEYDADVVYCEQFYEQDKNGDIKIQSYQSGDLVDKPTVDPQDIQERVQALLDKRYHSTPWLKLVQRNLLIEHEIFFPTLKISDDNIWTQGLVIYAKRILRVPNVIYTWRFNKESISRVYKTPEEFINYYINPIFLGLKYLDNLMSGHEFFKENPSYRYALLKYFVDTRFSWTLKSSMELTENEIYQSLKAEFGEKLGEYDVLVSALCTSIFEQKKKLFSESLKLKQTKQLLKNKRLLAEKDAEINRLRAALAFQNSLLPQANYAISVIIPLYNAAEFIGQCLESLLIQTFQDFEVIVVDDCSTDNSLAVVESYRPKFNGRLRLTKTEKNSGGGGYVPRNVGFKLARGNYVYFMDADDFLLGTALEIFYTTAEKHAVDVVYTVAVYDLKNPNDVVVRRDSNTKGLASKVLEDEEYDKFLHELAFEGVFTYPWVCFVRRDFLLQNNIAFPEIMKAGDYLWVISICCQTKKIFRFIKPLYFYNQYNVNSVSRLGSAIISHSKWILAFVDFIKALNELVGKIKFLNNNPDYVYGISKRYFGIISSCIAETNKSLSSQEIYEILYYDFIGKPSDLMIPFFFSAINDKEKELTDIRKVFLKFKPYIFARVDIKLLSTKGDFQIVSVSDDKAEIRSPAWLNVGGIGYKIQSYVGKMEVVAKSSVDGRVSLNLRGMDVKDPEDNSKRIPYWIDYTKLIINRKILFDTVTPVWLENPYRHTIDVKANEEVKIQVYWQPHRNDTVETPTTKITAPAQKISAPSKPETVKAKIEPPKVTAPESKVTAPSKTETVKAKIEPPKVTTPESKVATLLKKHETAKIDVKLQSVAGDLQILSLSDKNAEVSKPGWLQKKGVGYSIQSDVGKLEFIAKATANGRLNCNLKGLSVFDPNFPTKRIPYWVNYTKLTVNDKVIFNTRTPAWNDKPFRHIMDVKAGDEIKIQVEW